MENNRKKIQLKGLPIKELCETLVGMKEQKFRGRQVFDWLYNHMVDSVEDMANIPKPLRRKLEKLCDIYALEFVEEKVSETSGTRKYLFNTADGHLIESVLIPNGEESYTLCVSSQAGCPLGCKFCATGYLGFKRSLSSGEIVDQYILAAKKIGDESISNIVFMGMGEPLLNYDETVRAIKIFTDEFNKNISRKKVTVSTSGVAPGIRDLSDSGLRVKLALSLHCMIDEKRALIMPIAQKYKLKETLRAARNYAKKTGTIITFEYTLFKDFNDTRDDIREMVQMCKTLPCKVNIIPYNSIEHMKPENEDLVLIPASRDDMEVFANELRKKDITVMIRETQGQDILAACGQLAATKK